MIVTQRRRGWRPAGLVIATAAIGMLTFVPSADAKSLRSTAPTTGCRAVGGGTVDASGGPHRATVVVDTGSGAVWSACISFSGTISGIEALSRADAVITDLDPVFDQYTGLGRAVCRLRGVGTDPPDCLGKAASYWSYSHNGRVAPVGGGAVTVRDGDVQGWRHGSGGLPRAATEGTGATAAAPAPPTTTAPPTVPAPTVPTKGPTTPTTRPSEGGGLSETPSPPRDGTTSTTVARPEDREATTNVPGEIDASTTTPAGAGATDRSQPGDGEPGDAGGSAAAEDDGGTQAAANDDETAGAAGSPSVSGGDSSGGGSAAGSVAGFLAALVAVGAAGIVLRRRRSGLHPAAA